MENPDTSFPIPPELSEDIVVLDFDAPSYAELEASLDMNRPGFPRGRLLRFTRLYRTRCTVHRTLSRPRLAGCFRLVAAGVDC